MGRRNKSKGSSSGGDKATKLLLGVTAIGVVALIFALLGGGFGELSISGDDSTSTDSSDSGDGETSAQATFCANNPSLDAEVRILDDLSTSASYLNGTLYIENVEKGSVTQASVTTGGTSSFETLTNTFKCGAEGYKVYVKADGTINSDGVIELEQADLYEDPVQLPTIKASRYAPFKVQAYDNDARAYATAANYADEDGVANGTGFSNVLLHTFESSTSGIDFSGSADAELDITFTLKQNVSRTMYGEGIYIAVNTEDDSNTNDWDEDSIVVKWDGTILSEATDEEVPQNDKDAMASYEKIYKVTGETIGAIIGEDGSLTRTSENSLGFSVATTAGNSADFDPVISIVALGDTGSDENTGMEVLTNIGFRDDSSTTQLYNKQTITLEVN